MPILQWAAGVVNKTNNAEREQMQSIFDTAFWTLTVNRKLRADTEISLMAIASRAAIAFAYCQDGKWTADLK